MQGASLNADGHVSVKIQEGRSHVQGTRLPCRRETSGDLKAARGEMSAGMAGVGGR